MNARKAIAGWPFLTTRRRCHVSSEAVLWMRFHCEAQTDLQRLSGLYNGRMIIGNDFRSRVGTDQEAREKPSMFASLWIGRARLMDHSGGVAPTVLSRTLISQETFTCSTAERPPSIRAINRRSASSARAGRSTATVVSVGLE